MSRLTGFSLLTFDAYLFFFRAPFLAFKGGAKFSKKTGVGGLSFFSFYFSLSVSLSLSLSLFFFFDPVAFFGVALLLSSAV